MVALLVLAMALEAAGAQPSPPSYQNGFNQACRSRGGTTKRVGSRVVRCTLPDGSAVTCNFNYDPPVCAWALTASGEVAFDPTGGVVLAPDEAGASGPAAPVSNGVLTTDGAEPSGDSTVVVGTNIAPTGGRIVLADDDEEQR
jgi:hypothetical protein